MNEIAESVVESVNQMTAIYGQQLVTQTKEKLNDLFLEQLFSKLQTDLFNETWLKASKADLLNCWKEQHWVLYTMFLSLIEDSNTDDHSNRELTLYTVLLLSTNRNIGKLSQTFELF